MKKHLLCLLFAAGGLLTSCVDSKYDLGALKTDNISIGDESMVKELPLARVYISMNEIANNQSDILALCIKADKWLPTPLPGGADYLDLTRINDETYVGGIFDALIDQMEADPEKLETVAALVYEDYAGVFADLLGVPAARPDLFHEAFVAGYNNPYVVSELRSCFTGFLDTDLRVDAFHYDLGSINLSSDVVDMLADNLDPEGTVNPVNTLNLAGEITCKLPISMRFEPTFTTEWGEKILSFSAEIDAAREVNEIAESDDTRIYAEGLRQLIDGAKISIPVLFERYYPGDSEFLNTPADDDSAQIEIKLHLIKRGGIKFNL